jgi:branched-chain amino acid transport system ATP-binding protein
MCSPAGASGLWLEDLRVAIRGFSVLRGVSLAVPAGGLVALVGRNGAGKTTTLRTIMGLLAVDGGRLAWDGTDLVQVPAYRRARLGIGYVPEDRRLIGQLSVRDNLLLPAWSVGHPRPDQRLDEVFQLMPDVVDLVGRRAAQLSGGQQKLVALARALVNGTRLLLLDEPFEGLSPALGERLAETIRRARAAGRAVLMAESDLKRVGFAERTYTIERGANIRVDP